MKFKSLSELTRELNVIISGEEFKLTLEDLENVNQLAREISERLIVLRHKAYEKLVRPEDILINDTKNLELQESAEKMLLELSSEMDTEVATPFFQMSLIDAIEEAAAVEEEKHQVETESTNSEGETEEIQQVKAERDLCNNEEATHVIATKENDVVNDIREELVQSSISSPTQPITLADKHQFEKIDDLKRAITLNQRFQFSRELFKGNNQEYEVAIDRLNNSTREEALLMLRDLRAKFDWQEESSAALDFYGLVERRYSSL